MRLVLLRVERPGPVSGFRTWVRQQDWVLAAQLGCALVVTFHAEYTLALAAGVNEYVALAVPGALDLYVIRALQKHRDVFLAVLVMVAANVASHLVTAGIVPVGWAVYSAVGGTVPLLLWRGHSLRHTRTRKELLWGFPKWGASAPVPEPDEYTGTEPGAVKAPVLPGVPVPVCPWGHDECIGYDGCTVYPSGEFGGVPVQVSDVDPVPAPVLGDRYHQDGCDGFCLGAGSDACLDRSAVLAARTRRRTDVPDHVPAEWAEPSEVYPPLAAVPELPDVPAEYASGAVHSPVLIDSDWVYLDRASEYVHGCKDLKRKPSVRGIRRVLKIGQDRAERLLEHLGVEP